MGVLYFVALLMRQLIVMDKDYRRRKLLSSLKETYNRRNNYDLCDVRYSWLL